MSDTPAKAILLSALAAAVLIICVVSSSATARVACIRITSEHSADVSDLGRFGRYSAWKDKTGNDLALAVWKYLCGHETGVYHFNEILEKDDPFDEYATVRDPLKILNVYNMGYCGIFGPVLDGIFQGIGFEQGRAFGVSGWNHCATEVWYDGGWHYIDLDVRGCLLDPRGVAASLDEVRRDRSLWVDPVVAIEPFFPKDDDKNKLFEIYRDSRIDYCYRWFEGSHTMDFYLRQGETFTRWWKPQGGRWHHLERYNKSKWLRKLIETPPVGAKPNHRDFTRWNHGNGLFHYEPDLTDKSSDFADGVYSVNNLTPGKAGLRLADRGKAEAIFEVFTPYIIVAKINDLDDISDDAEASTVGLETFLPVEIDVSLDHGATWRGAGVAGADSKTAVDLTRLVRGTYGYLVRLRTSGPAGAAAIKSLTIDTWVQVAPVSLPRLRKGTNHLRYEVGDRYGKPTLPMLVRPNTGDAGDLKKYVTAMPSDYDPKRHTCRIRGDAVLHLKAPPDTMISWFSVGAAFRTHQGAAAAKTDNRISYAAASPEGFTEIYRSSVPAWVNHWRYNWDGDVVLDEPAGEVFVKFTGNPGLNTMRACLHLSPRKSPRNAVEITHTYRADSRIHSKRVELDEPGEYTVTCADDPENVSVSVRVGSQLKDFKRVD